MLKFRKSMSFILSLSLLFTLVLKSYAATLTPVQPITESHLFAQTQLDIPKYKYYHAIENDLAKKMYEAIYDKVNGDLLSTGSATAIVTLEDFEFEFNVPAGELKNDPMFKKFVNDNIYSHVATAFAFFIADNPQLFWLDTTLSYSAPYSYINNGGGNYSVTFKSAQMNLKVYSPYLVNTAEKVNAFNNVVNTVKSTVSGLSRLDTLMTFLKYLCNYVEYDYSLASSLEIYNAYGALINYLCVCEGYAEAFATLCEAVGIPCVIVQGLADGGNHEWVYVQMENGKWYAVDPTWADQETVIVYDLFLAGSNTVLESFFPGDTLFKDSHIPNSLAFYSITTQDYPYPLLADNTFDPLIDVPTTQETTEEQKTTEKPSDTTIEPTKPTDITTLEPTKPTDVTTIEPTKPTDVTTIEPTKPTDVTTIEPTKPTDVTTIEPTKPTDVTTIEPTKPTDVTTIEPTKPTDVTTLEPTKTTDETTAEPTKPTGTTATETTKTTQNPTQSTSKTTQPSSSKEPTTASTTEKVKAPEIKDEAKEIISVNIDEMLLFCSDAENSSEKFLSFLSAGYKLKNIDGKILDSNDFVTTGSVLVNEETLEEFEIVIMGDLNGDGVVTSVDARIALRVSAQLTTIEGAYLQAATVISADITAVTARKILRVSAQLESFKK